MIDDIRVQRLLHFSLNLNGGGFEMNGGVSIDTILEGSHVYEGTITNVVKLLYCVGLVGINIE